MSTEPDRHADTVRALTVAERHIVRADRFESLLREARDLLWHSKDHSPSGKHNCPGCALESRIDGALIQGCQHQTYLKNPGPHGYWACRWCGESIDGDERG